MHREEPVSATHQMYLKALYHLSRTRPIGRVRDLARELGVTPGTVSTGLTRLQQLGLVDRERYGGVQLTPAGSAVADCVNRRYETLKAVLIEVFGVEPENARSDACLMEHAVSPVTMNRMAAILARLRAGESIDLQSLKHHHDHSKRGCADCEAAGVCQAAESAVALTAETHGAQSRQW
jgi:DtxR family Mn-dependent transcriptional regulator